MKKYSMVWFDEQETWKYFVNLSLNEIKESVKDEWLNNGYTLYNVTIDGDIITDDEYKLSNVGKRFSDVYGFNI